MKKRWDIFPSLADVRRDTKVLPLYTLSVDSAAPYVKIALSSCPNDLAFMQRRL